MKINVAKNKFLLCFRPTIESEEPINNNQNQHAPRRKVFWSPKTPSPTNDNGRTHKRSLSRFLKNVLLGNALTKRFRKRKRSAKNSEQPPTKEPQIKPDIKNKNQTFTTVDANHEDAVFPLSPSATSLYSVQTQETNNYGDGGGGCSKVAAVEQERGLRYWPQISCRGSMVTNYIKTTFISAVSHRYVAYAILAVFGVTVFLRFNGVFLTCVWLYLAGGPLTPVFSGERQPTTRRRPYLMY